MSNLEQELIEAGYIQLPSPVDGVAVFTWLPLEHQDAGYCTVCGCNAGECGGPTEPGDMDPDTSLCACYDDELGEPCARGNAMPALNFQARFVQAVESGRKRQSIRAQWKDGRFPFRPRQRLHLYTGLPTPAARKLGEGIISRVAAICIEEADDVGPLGHVFIAGRGLDDYQAEDLAQAEGFNDFDEMMTWWRERYGLPFDGFIIYWDPTGP